MGKEIDYRIFSLIILVCVFFLDLRVKVSNELTSKEDRESLLLEIEKHEFEPCVIGVPNNEFWDTSYSKSNYNEIVFKEGHVFEIDGKGDNVNCYYTQYFSNLLF